MTVQSEIELDHLDLYLRRAPVLHAAAFDEGTGIHAAHSFRLTLLGGGVVLAKPADVISGGAEMVRREVAAFVVARYLGWSDLISATALRDLDRGSSVSRCSVQLLWARPLHGRQVHEFTLDDQWRAAVFDVLIHHTDRHAGKWLAIEDEGGELRLKLVDHGYAFGDDGRSFRSEFYNAHANQPLPGPCGDAVAAFVGECPWPPLRDLLSPQT